MFHKVIHKSHVTWLNNYVRTLLDLLAGLGQLMMTFLNSLNKPILTAEILTKRI